MYILIQKLNWWAAAFIIVAFGAGLFLRPHLSKLVRRKPVPTPISTTLTPSSRNSGSGYSSKAKPALILCVLGDSRSGPNSGLIENLRPRLAAALRGNIVVVNRAYPGTTSRDWAINQSRYKKAKAEFVAVKAANPGITILCISMIGTNDVKTTIMTSPAIFKSRTVARVNDLYKTGIRTVLNYCPLVNENKNLSGEWGVGSNARLNALNATLPTIVRENPRAAVLGERTAAALVTPQIYTVDGVHLGSKSAAGNVFLAQLQAAALYQVCHPLPN